MCGWIISITQLSAQPVVKIASGTYLKQSGNVSLVIKNADLEIEGVLEQETSDAVLYMSGNTNQSLSSSGPLVLHNLVVNKAQGTELVLENELTMNTAVTFISGLLNLNGFNLLLQPGALLQNESEISYVTGDNGGYIQTEADLNTPVAANPGNLGAIISSSADMGNTIIRRGHVAQASGTHTGIKRYYDIFPANNTALDAVLRFHYLEAELNGLSEEDAELGRSTDHINWVNESEGIVYDPVQNYIQKTGIPSFSRWSIFGEGALPVELISFEGKVNDGGSAALSWITVSETAFSHFELERSQDNRHFDRVASISAKGTNTGNTSYHYQDHNLIADIVYYRLKMVDRDGTYTYSRKISLQSDGTASVHFYPNPVQNLLTLESPRRIGTIEIFNTKGDRVKKYESETSINEISMELLPAGLYFVKINKNEVIKIIRQ